jgi:tRNA threonylcarbamoyladenosine biosynthesis protein TsaB
LFASNWQDGRTNKRPLEGCMTKTDPQTPRPLTVLSIDTCEANCSAALLSEGKVRAARIEAIGRGHAERLLPMLDELLIEAGLEYADLDRIGVTTGPGTFTGLRIGLSVARGLGLSLGIPVVGVTSLFALAADVRDCRGAVHAVVMGRGGQAYHQTFSVDPAGLPVALSEGASLDAADIEAMVAATPGRIVGSGAPLLGSEYSGAPVSPGAVAFLAATLDPASFLPEPAYLRAADAVRAKSLLPVEQE